MVTQALIQALGKLRQKDYEFDASLGYIASKSLYQNQKQGQVWRSHILNSSTWKAEAGRSGLRSKLHANQE